MREPSLIVWGRIRNGELILEPAFEATTEARLPVAAGPNLLAGLRRRRRRGRSAWPSAAPRWPTPRDAEEQFAFAVPLRMVRGSLARIRLESRGQRAELATTGARAAARPTDLRLSRAGGTATVRWNAAEYPLAVIRDASGRILSLARGGSVTLDDAAGTLDVTLSDRTRSQTERLP